MNLPRANPIFAIHNQPHRGKPFIQTYRRIFKNSSSLESELWRRMLLSAMPTIVFFEEQNILASTARTDHSVGPATSDHIFAAVGWISEVENRFLEGFRFACHASRIGENRYFVNYIIAEIIVRPMSHLPPPICYSEGRR